MQEKVNRKSKREVGVDRDRIKELREVKKEKKKRERERERESDERIKGRS